MVLMLIFGIAVLASDPQGAAQIPSGAGSTVADAAALAEYNTRRANITNTADAHWKLGLWCEQKGLKGEATVEFLAVTQLDPRHESAWKRLGYEKQNGRWTTAAQVATMRAEAEAQRKADLHWRPLFLKWKAGLGQESRRADAEAALAAVTDPRAVPSIWKVFALGGPADQERAIDMLGHIEGERPARPWPDWPSTARPRWSAGPRSRPLIRHPHDAGVMAWIGLLHAPTRYEVRQVGGPGTPGVLLVEGERFNFRRFYAPPSVEQTEDLFVDPQAGRPVLPLQLNSPPPGPPPGSRRVGKMGNTDLYVRDDQWAGSNPVQHFPDPFAPAGAVPNRVQYFPDPFAFTEAAKMAGGAQAQLEHDIAVVEASNATVRETNARLVEALRRVSGKDFGTDREAWLKWWMSRRGYAYIPPDERPKTTLDMQVALPYVPQSGPPAPTSGGGGGSFLWSHWWISAIEHVAGGGGSHPGWCLIWDHEKGRKARTDQCFAAGTWVLTPQGPRAIETLRAGDSILAADELGRDGSPATILSMHRSSASRTLRLVVSGEAIVTTAGHPFWKPGTGWTRAGDLAPGDSVVAGNGPARVEAIEACEGQTVWNLRLSGASCFRVGRLGVLVHDISPIADVPPIPRSVAEE